MGITNTSEAASLIATEKSAWPIGDIILGLTIPLFFMSLSYLLGSLDQFQHRPWIATPARFALGVLGSICLLLYPLYLSRKRDLGPLISRVSVSDLLVEFLRSILLLILVVFFVGLAVKVLAIILKEEITKPEVLKWAEYAPNSMLMILALIFGFTVVPISEELFFRGFLYNALKSRFSVFIAGILQALLFAVLHRYNLLNTFGLFLIGIALAVVYERRKNLLSPIFIHGIMNAVRLVPILILAVHNLHAPASTWEEARTQPFWLKAIPLKEIERQKNGMAQWEYAIDSWGSKGSREWKKEANAFKAVSVWFPEDRTACAKAKLGIVAIYLHFLRDYRRAVVETDDLLTRYPDHGEQCASALSKRGWAYYLLRDFQKSRESFTKVLDDYRDYGDAVESARKGIAGLNAVVGK